MRKFFAYMVALIMSTIVLFSSCESATVVVDPTTTTRVVVYDDTYYHSWYRHYHPTYVPVPYRPIVVTPPPHRPGTSHYGHSNPQARPGNPPRNGGNFRTHR